MLATNDSFSDALLVLRGVTVAATNGNVLLRAVNLSLRAGEIVAVTGPSGCGKTSLLRVICGLTDAAQESGDVRGQILLQDRTAAQWGWPIFRRNVLLVEQRPTVLDETVLQTLRRPFGYQANRHVSFPEPQARVLLDALGLMTIPLMQSARTLSVGEQQRLCLVRALLLEPVVVLLDEPTSALDSDAARQVEILLRGEAERRGLATLVVTHNERQAREWCDRAVNLSPFRVAPSSAA